MQQTLTEAAPAPVTLRATPAMRLLLTAIALVAIAVPLAILVLAPPPAKIAARRVPQQHVVPPAELPPA